MRRPAPVLPFVVSLALLPAFLPLSTAAPAAEPARGEHLDVRAPDGVVLRATHWSPGKPGPGVLLLHMCNSDRTAWSGLGPRLAEKGIHALALDYRGYGESGGERPEDPEGRRRERAKWPGDVDAAFAALRARTGAESPIFGAAGGSCGVHQAIQLARRHPEVRTLVLLAGDTDREGEDFLADNPWLPVFAAAARDDGNAVETTRWVQGFSAHPDNRFAEYPDGGHGTEIFRVHADLEPAIATWFEQHLVAEPVEHPAPGGPGASPEPGPSAELRESLLRPGGAAAVRARHAGAKAEAASPPPPEAVVNVLGYQRLQEGETAAAIELFELNVELYPDSANVYDSLADAYLAADRPEIALLTARKALARLPADPSQDDPGEQAIREAARAKVDQLTKPND
jgi:dienelactone hydrolase